MAAPAGQLAGQQPVMTVAMPMTMMQAPPMQQQQQQQPMMAPAMMQQPAMGMNYGTINQGCFM